MTPAGAPSGGDAARLAGDLDRRCLRGLVGAAVRLAGDDPAPVCAAFRTWKRAEGWRAWPWLPGLCWSALEPLGVGFPVADDDAVTLGRFLVGAESDPERVRAALAAHSGGAAPSSPGTVAELGVEVRRRTLETAVDRFWADLGGMAARLRDPVAEGARDRADAIILAGRRQLEDTAGQIDGHVQRLLDALAHPASPRAEPAATDHAAPRGGSGQGAALKRPVPEPAEPEPVVEAAPGPARDGAAPPPEGEDVEYRRVREHRLAPVVFLAGVTLVALVWLFMIATAAGR